MAWPGSTTPASISIRARWRTFLNKTISSLRYIAEETGGFAVVNDNDFETAFKRIDAETSDYYVLGYYSTNPDVKQRVRAVDVQVDASERERGGAQGLLAEVRGAAAAAAAAA